MNPVTLKRILVTDEHPFWVMDHGWTPASRLTPGMTLATADGREVAIVSNTDEGRPEGITVYNFEVGGAHTYFVADASGDEGFAVWVHNARRQCAPEFSSLKDYARRHGRLGQSVNGYYAEAVRHAMTGRRFRVSHEGRTKHVFLTREGPDTFLFTSASLSGRRILTHMRVQLSYLRAKGITLPKGF